MRVTLDTAGGFQDPKSVLATNPTVNPLQSVWLQGKQSQQPLLVGSKDWRRRPGLAALLFWETTASRASGEWPHCHA